MRLCLLSVYIQVFSHQSFTLHCSPPNIYGGPGISPLHGDGEMATSGFICWSSRVVRGGSGVTAIVLLGVRDPADAPIAGLEAPESL